MISWDALLKALDEFYIQENGNIYYPDLIQYLINEFGVFE